LRVRNCERRAKISIRKVSISAFNPTRFCFPVGGSSRKRFLILSIVTEILSGCGTNALAASLWSLKKPLSASRFVLNPKKPREDDYKFGAPWLSRFSAQIAKLAFQRRRPQLDHETCYWHYRSYASKSLSASTRSLSTLLAPLRHFNANGETIEKTSAHPEH
jgi:hypothetical protein